jgi:hypothetical protein
MPTDKLKLEELSREQILDLTDAAGRKLGFLLASSALDDEVKNAIVDILDQATPAQLDTLTQMFEKGYLRSQNKDLDDFLKAELEGIKADFKAIESDLEKETLTQLENLGPYP